MIRELYSIPNGMSGKIISNRLVMGLLTGIWLIIFGYVSAYFKVSWIEGGIPAIIQFYEGGDISIGEYAATMAFLVVILQIIQVYWLSTQSAAFFNRTTMQILLASQVSPVKMYFSFVLKRFIDLSILTIVCAICIVSMYYLRDGAFVYPLLTNIFTLLYLSLLLIAIFDFLNFFTRTSAITSVITIVVMIFFSFFSYSFSPILEEMTNSELAKLADAIPDLLSMPYHFFLMSFSGTYSSSKLYYPIAFLACLMLLLYLLSKKLFFRFSTRE